MRRREERKSVAHEVELGVLGPEDELLWEWSPLKYADQIAAPR